MMDKAVFVGGCFWCIQEAFDGVEGILQTTVGYTGGFVDNPTYEKVCYTHTGHYEALEILFDKSNISYERLLEIFLKAVDPTDKYGQFCDIGNQYRPAVFYTNENQKNTSLEAVDIIKKAEIFDKPLSVNLLPFEKFYKAEEYHQSYHKKYRKDYLAYKNTSGRLSFKEKVWENRECFRLFPHKKDYWIGYKKPSKGELKNILSKQQYSVICKNATETPFDNLYWNETRDGIYVDAVSKEPLFCSLDKFDSKTGWPSFTKPLEAYNIVEYKDFSFSMERIEVRSRYADSHLGHLFYNESTQTGLRYCINSASLEFIEKEKLNRCGYGFYTKFFD